MTQSFSGVTNRSGPPGACPSEPALVASQRRASAGNAGTAKAGRPAAGSLEVMPPLVETSVMERPDSVPFPGTLAHYSDDPLEPVYFYGGPFSNFVGGPFVIQSPQPWSKIDVVKTYATIEHFFQASKAWSEMVHDWINKDPGPWECKKRGNTRRIPGTEMPLLRTDWEEVKYGVMLIGLRFKFKEPGWRRELLATGLRYIAEDSPTDFVWGIRDKRGGTSGRNLLGEALMEIRAEIRAEE